MGKTVERMLEATREIWEKYNEHPFVQGIENGTLDKEKFRFYILQDYLYLQDYAKAFAVGLAKAKSPSTTRLFSGYLNQLVGSEMDIHRGYLGKLAVTQEELDTAVASLDNLSYTSYMLRVAYEEGEAEILGAILACAYSYECIAKKMVSRNPAAVEDAFYGDWIRGYASAEYAEENRVLLDTMDRLTAQYTQAQIAHLVDIFVACSRYELAFWEMSWNQQL